MAKMDDLLCLDEWINIVAYAPCKNFGATETAVAKQSPQATIEEVSRYVTRKAVAV
jgi:hypothetical protein